MDEAFMPFGEIVERMVPRGAELVDEDAGVRSYIYEFEIEAPVELDVYRDEDGAVRIGTTPPLYYIETSIRPSFHKLRFVAELEKDRDAG